MALSCQTFVKQQMVLTEQAHEGMNPVILFIHFGSKLIHSFHLQFMGFIFTHESDHFSHALENNANKTLFGFKLVLKVSY